MKLNLIGGAAILVLAGAVCAQPLADPMRPPVEFLPAGSSGPAVTLPAAQMVILSEGRKQVMLNGQTLSVGGRLGDSRIESLNDSEIVLRVDNRTRERIPLYPGIAKTPSAVASKQQQGAGSGRTEGRK